MHRHVRKLILAAAATLANPVLCLAQHEAAGEGRAAEKPVEAIQGLQEGLATGITALVVFAIVFAILAAKVWPTITKALDERAAKIRGEIEAAEAARAQAKSALEQYQKSLAEARAEAQKILDQAKLQQQAISAELKAKADAELSVMRERATRDIEIAKKEALSEIYAHSVNLAASMAGKILRREVSGGDNSRLVDESLSELAGRR